MIVRLVAVLGAAVVLFFLGSVAAPSSARAYVVPPGVVEPGPPPTLTPAAESIVRNPTFLAENVGEAEAVAAVDGGVVGATEAGGLATVLEAAGAFPIGALAFGAGVGIGTALCHVVPIFGSCLFEERTESVGSSGSWSFRIQRGESHFPAGEFTVWPPLGVWYATNSGVEIIGGRHGCPEDSIYLPFPPAATASVVIGPTGGSCDPGHTVGEYEMPIRSEFQGVSLGVGDGGFGEELHERAFFYDGSRHFEPAPDWSSRLAAVLSDPEAAAGEFFVAPAAVEKAGQWLAHKVDPSEASDPYVESSPLPLSCEVGQKAPPCIAALEELEVVPEVTELDWEDAVVEELDKLEPEKTREKESERIVELPSPLPAEVTKGSDFPITVNPSEEEMPEFIPEPGEDETAEEYKERKLPWLPLPFWHAEELDDATLDPTKGPEEISRLDPAPGTRVDPSGETDVHAKVNPADAPVPGGGTAGGPVCSASVGSIDWSPLNRPLGSRFPFGVFGFFVGWLAEWEAREASTPDWSVPLLPAGVFGSSGIRVDIDLAFLSPAVSVVRVAFLFASFVGLLWFLGTAAAKLQGDDS